MEMASLLVVRVLHFNSQQDFKLIFSPMFVASLILHDQASKNYIFGLFTCITFLFLILFYRECVGTLEVLDHRDLKETKVQMELRDRLEKEERRYQCT